MCLLQAYLMAITDSKRAKVKQNSKSELARLAAISCCDERVADQLISEMLFAGDGLYICPSPVSITRLGRLLVLIISLPKDTRLMR